VNNQMGLKELLNIIFEQKRIAISVFLIFAVVSIIVTVLTPEYYRISMIIEPAALSDIGKENGIYIDKPKNIKSKIQEGAFNSKVAKALGLASEGTELKFKAFQPRGSNLIKVSVDQKEKNKARGVEILNHLFNILDKSYEGQISRHNEKERRQIEIFEERKKVLLSEIKKAQDYYEMLISRKSEFEKNAGENPDIENLLYINIVQQQTAYLSELNRELARLNIRKENTALIIENMPNERKDITADGLKEDSFNLFVLVQEPEISPHPVSPDKRISIALGLFLGLISGVFASVLINMVKEKR